MATEAMIETCAIWAPTLLCATVRAAGLMLAAPVLGHAAVPARLRLLAAVAVGLAAASRLASPVTLPGDWASLAGGLAGELLIGAGMGYAGRLIFLGVELGAAHVGAQMGLSLAEAADPSRDEPAGPVGGLYYMLAIVVFLAAGGHRALIGGLMTTFDTVPLLGFVPRAGMADVLLGLVGGSFVLATKLAAPMLVAMLTATVLLGLLQRTLPQLNVLSAELPGRALLGLAVTAATLTVVSPLMESAADSLGAEVVSLVQRAR
jgi:flagellar biosynthetic protein FliR